MLLLCLTAFGCRSLSSQQRLGLRGMIPSNWLPKSVVTTKARTSSRVSSKRQAKSNPTLSRGHCQRGMEMSPKICCLSVAAAV